MARAVNCWVYKFSLHVLDLTGHDRLIAKLKFEYLAPNFQLMQVLQSFILVDRHQGEMRMLCRRS